MQEHEEAESFRGSELGDCACFANQWSVAWSPWPEPLNGVEMSVLSLISLPLIVPGLVGIAFICWGVYLAVKISRMPPDRPGVERGSESMKEEEQPDGMGGVVAVVLCIALVAFLIIVPAGKGASPEGKFCLAGLALSGVGWGLRQIRLARAQDKRDAEAAKERKGENGV